MTETFHGSCRQFCKGQQQQCTVWEVPIGHYEKCLCWGQGAALGQRDWLRPWRFPRLRWTKPLLTWSSVENPSYNQACGLGDFQRSLQPACLYSCDSYYFVLSPVVFSSCLHFPPFLERYLPFFPENKPPISSSLHRLFSDLNLFFSSATPPLEISLPILTSWHMFFWVVQLIQASLLYVISFSRCL